MASSLKVCIYMSIFLFLNSIINILILEILIYKYLLNSLGPEFEESLSLIMNLHPEVFSSHLVNNNNNNNNSNNDNNNNINSKNNNNNNNNNNSNNNNNHNKNTNLDNNYNNQEKENESESENENIVYTGETTDEDEDMY
jgi:preprotein translocase subunit SecF